ncbi:MAG: aspartate kinase [Candidatus Bathyarchaeia archaeon]
MEKSRILVVKFGGASLADGEKIRSAVKAVANELAKGTKMVVVVSAMGKTTDNLLDAARTAAEGKLSPRELDDVVSMGERTSARIFAAALRSEGVKAEYFDPAQGNWPIITDEAFGNARPNLAVSQGLIERHVLPLLGQGLVPVVPGFVGKTRDGAITTLGRGGSDTTAFILARAVHADQVILVTSAEGIMTADPKLIKKPKVIREIQAESLAGLADTDAKFIHRKALRYKDPSIDAKVIDYTAGRLDAEGTIIKGGLPQEITAHLAYEGPLLAATVVGKTLADSPTFLGHVTEEIERTGVSSLGMSTNSDCIILYLPEKGSQELLERLHTLVLEHPNEAFGLATKKNLALIKFTGAGLEDTPGVIGRITKPLYENSINIAGILTVASSILLFVNWNEREKVLQLTRRELGAGAEVN